MKTKSLYRNSLPLPIVVLVIFFCALTSTAQTTFIDSSTHNKKSGGKELYLPAKIGRVPDKNDFNSPESEYSYKRMAQSDNIAVFWAKEFGDDPMQNPDSIKRFNVKEALKECERFYSYYVNELKFVHKGKSLTDKYKILFFVISGAGQTAFGGGAENKVGILWTPAARMNKAPYGALAHELGHAFQYLARSDNGTGLRGSIMEMSAQYFLWQVYPQWMTFENYHLVNFMQKTHFAFLHPTNMYHSPYVIEYWSNKHGIKFFGELCRNVKEGEDPVMVYKRLNGLSQEQFNDEMFDASRRFITWDMKRIEKVARPYADQHKTKLIPINDNWLRIDTVNCPQNYGYNGIKLKVPEAGTVINLDFKGIAGAEGYSITKTDKAGWRYGFVAHKKNGKRVYGEVYKNATGTATFKVPKNTEYLWLVVSGAPTEHWPVAIGGRNRTQSTEREEQWPYEIKISGTTLDM